MAEVDHDDTGLSDAQIQAIQTAANRTQQTIYLVGSRAHGGAGWQSDWDYILTGTSQQVQAAKPLLPGFTSQVVGDDNVEGVTNTGRGIDVWQGGKALATPPHLRPGASGRLVPNPKFNPGPSQRTMSKVRFEAVDPARPYAVFYPGGAKPEGLEGSHRMDMERKGSNQPKRAAGQAFTITFRR